MLTIDASLIRLTWSVIEETQSINLLSLTDTGLVRLLLQRISEQMLLNGEEVCLLYDYISAKTTLIRDIADSSFVYTISSIESPMEATANLPSSYLNKEKVGIH